MPSKSVTTGDAATAQSWVAASSLSEADKRALLTFIDRFPDLTFYHDGPERLDLIEERQGVTLPRWFRAFLHTLTYVMPDHYVWARFSHSRDPGLQGDLLQGRWYLLNALGNPSDEEQELLDRMQGLRLYPVGQDEVTGNSTIAINLADLTDEQLYQYSYDQLESEARGGYTIEEAVHLMFTSYADMFAHIDALKMLAKADIDMVDDKDWPEPTIVEARG